MKYYFSINMTSEEFMPYYRGQIHWLIVTSTEGKRIQFPAMHIRKYLTRSGVRGYFCMETRDNKFLSLTKLR